MFSRLRNVIREAARGREALEVDARPGAVPQVRRWVRRALSGWQLDALTDDAELVLTELVSNAVLHAAGRVRIVVTCEPDGVLLEVLDSSPVAPVRRAVSDGGTTGRGLHLVAAMASAWGVSPRPDDAPGKTVWCRLRVGVEVVEPDLAPEDLLAAFDDEAAGFEVTVGDAPTALLRAAKDHLDGLLREFALAESSSGALPHEVAEGITAAATAFGEARAQLRRQLNRATQDGLPRVVLRFALPAELADAGEAYLRALAEADTFARDRRMLSLESPVAFRVLREWYVLALVQGLRDAQAGRPPSAAESFEQRLLGELEVLEQRTRENALAALLQRVTGRLAAAQTLQEVGEAAVSEGITALACAGGTLTRPEGACTAPIVESGIDVGLGAQYGRDGAPVGPSTRAIRSGEQVYVESRDERDEQFPHLAGMQPDAVALAAAPLAVAGEIVGALRFSFVTPHVFSRPERAYLSALAAQTAQAVARVDALERLQRAETRSRTLAALGDRLASAHGVTNVAEAVADVVLPTLGDLMALHLLGGDGRITFALARHRDPRLTPALEAMLQRFPVSLDHPIGAGRVLATGALQDLPVVTDEMLREIADGDDSFLGLMRELDVRGGTIVPLTAGGRTLGALSLARSGTRPISDQEIEMAAEVGRRAGVAVANVRALGTSARLDLVLSATNIGSYEMALPGGEVAWDDEMFRLLEIDPATFDGSLDTFFARVLPEDAVRVAEVVDRAVAEVGELTVDYRVQLRDGSLRWIEGHGRVLATSDGTPVRLVGVAVDVTAQRDASARALRSLELMADGFVQLDRDGVISYANVAAEELLGAPRAALVGSSLHERVPAAAALLADPADEPGTPLHLEASVLGRELEIRAHRRPEGVVVSFTDLAQRRRTERERDRALSRLQLLNDVGAALTETLDVDEALPRLVGRLVPAFADVATIDLVEGDAGTGGAHGGGGTGRDVVVTAADPVLAEALRRADELLPRRSNPQASVNRVLSGEPYALVTVTPEVLDRAAISPEHRRLYADMDIRQALVVPLVARGRVLGALSLLRVGPQAVPYADADVQFALDIGRRAGLNVDNALQYTAQRAVAEGLQRSLLPDLPTVEGARLGAAYEPSSSQAKVGGDWYDAFVLPDGALGLVIGDVMGHDIAAAAAMGQLRSVLRTCAVGGDGPAVVLDRLDRLVESFEMADLATVVYARLTRCEDGSGLLEWANAGHPPPLLLAPGEPARYLDGGRSTMIGVWGGEARQTATELLPVGSTLLMFTDGVVERRGDDLDDRLDLLRTVAAGLVRDAAADDPDALCAQLLAAVRDGSHDDAAVVAVRLSDLTG